MKSLKLQKLLHWVENMYFLTFDETDELERYKSEISVFITTNSYKKIKNGLLEIAVKGEFNEPVTEQKKNRLYFIYKNLNQFIQIENDLCDLIDYVLYKYHIDNDYKHLLNAKKHEIQTHSSFFLTRVILTHKVKYYFVQQKAQIITM